MTYEVAQAYRHPSTGSLTFRLVIVQCCTDLTAAGSEWLAITPHWINPRAAFLSFSGGWHAAAVTRLLVGLTAIQVHTFVKTQLV